jgi:hypothetical protein
MKRLGILGLSAMLAAGLASSPCSVVAQQKSLKEQLVGTWILVSCDMKAADGTTIPPCVNPSGSLSIDASGRTQGFTGAPLTIKTRGGKELVLQGESTGGQLGTRSWVGAWDLNNGQLAWRTFTIPAPGEPGSETWKDNHNAWQTASFDPDTNLLYYGTGDAFPSFDPQFRPGDNLFTASTIALDADTGKIVWYF